MSCPSPKVYKIWTKLKVRKFKEEKKQKNEKIAINNWTTLTSLFDFFLVSMSGSLLMSLIVCVRYPAILPTIVANCFNVGENSTCKCWKISFHLNLFTKTNKNIVTRIFWQITIKIWYSTMTRSGICPSFSTINVIYYMFDQHLWLINFPTLSPSRTTLTLKRGFGPDFPSPLMARESSCRDHLTFNLNASSTILSIFSVYLCQCCWT